MELGPNVLYITAFGDSCVRCYHIQVINQARGSVSRIWKSVMDTLLYDWVTLPWSAMLLVLMIYCNNFVADDTMLWLERLPAFFTYL